MNRTKYPGAQSRIQRIAQAVLFGCFLSGWLLSAGVNGAEAQSTRARRQFPKPAANLARVDRLLNQMSLEEKVALIRGAVEPAGVYQGQAGYLAGVPRLHIPSLRFADGPPGLLTRIPAQGLTSTMGVAATFSTKDAAANGRVIGNEARSLGIDVVLQPFINMDRDITFGRGFNTFGEDPYLTAQVGAAEIEGVQSQDVMAMAKHYIGYDSNLYNVFMDSQTLHEVDLQPFAAAIKAGVSSLMCSYNRFNGSWACGNAETQKTILRGELGFEGFVTSDWGGVHSVDFLNQGLDMEMPGVTRPERQGTGVRPNFFELDPKEVAPPSERTLRAPETPGGQTNSIPEEVGHVTPGVEPVPWSGDGSSLYAALRDGTINEATITKAARRVLAEMERFGYLDGTQKYSVTTQAIAANARVMEKTAEDCAVLLKNDRGTLPLRAQDRSSLALIGPTAGQVDSVGLFGERSGGLPERQIGPFDAMRKLAPQAKIIYAVDDDMTGTPVPAEMLSHDGQPGLVRMQGDHKSVDDALNFTKKDKKALTANTTATWTGTLTVPSDGEYWIYLQVLGARGRLEIDGRTIGRTGAVQGGIHGDTQQAAQDNGIPTTDGLDNVRRAVHLSRGAHALSIGIIPDSSEQPAQVRLNWMTPDARLANHQAAITAARQAKAAVVFAWSRRDPVFGLPGDQDKLIEEIAAVNPNTIVVLNTSQPIAMPWIGKVKAVLQMWWPGDEGGWATAKVLLGMSNPGGRLPVTWGHALTDYAPNDPEHPERSGKGVDGKTTVSEGVLIGYRWFDAQNIEPIFPFGFGLSYTEFRYSNLQLKLEQDGSVSVRVRVSNIGKRKGDEVPQVYLQAPQNKPAGAQFAPHTLAAFDRITLLAGESRVVTLRVTARAFEYWSVGGNEWHKPPGSRVLYVGGSSRNLPLHAEVTP